MQDKKRIKQKVEKIKQLKLIGTWIKERRLNIEMHHT